MSISTISTLQKSLNSRQLLANQDRDVQKAQQELTTGISADIYSERSFRAAQTLDLRNRMSRTESYSVSNDLLIGKLDVTSGLMASIRQGVQEFQALSVAFANGTQGREVLQPQANALIKTITSQLNTVYSGEFLFSGANTGESSVNLDSEGFPDMGLDEAGNLQKTRATLQSIDAYFGLGGADLATSGYVQGGVYTGSDTRQTARIDESTLFSYGITANDESIRQIFKGLTMFAQVDIAAISDPNSYALWLDEANTALSAGIDAMKIRETELGNQQKMVAETSQRQKNLTELYNNRVVDIEGVDAYEAATRFEALSAQLETSLSVTARLKNLSLLNYL